MKPLVRERIEEAATATGKAVINIGGVAGTTALATTSPAMAIAVGILTPIISEFFSVVVPQRRMNRVETMLTYLMAKEAKIAPDTLQDRLSNDAEFAANFERGCIQAAQAQTKLRLEAIAGVIASQFRDSKKSLVADKFLSILNDLDDFDIYLLINMPDLPSFDPDQRNAFDAISEKNLITHAEKWFTGIETGFSERLEALYDEQHQSDFALHRSMAVHSMRRMESFGLVIPAEKPKMTYSGDQITDSTKGWRLTAFGHMVIEFTDSLQPVPPSNDE